jgi:hypothetical protein
MFLFMIFIKTMNLILLISIIEITLRRIKLDNTVVDIVGFCRWCITHRDTGFSDFVHRPDSK